MSVVGLVLLVLVAVLVPATGLPGFIVLMFAAVVGALAGVMNGIIPASFLAALPTRIVNLLENDLLQALPLYVLVGGLINRLPIAEGIFQTATRVLRGRAAPGVATLVLGGLLGPMNGSIGASVIALSRTAAPHLAASATPPAARHALIAAASTLGIVVPPSLVLILLGDAMMAAHTVAVNATHRSQQILNTQDVFRGALVPAGLFFAACVLVTLVTARRASVPAQRASTGARDALVALAAVAFVAGVLAGVATGRFYAVEGAAAGAAALFLVCTVTGRLRAPALAALLRETLVLTGTLFALLVAATTFTLVFRSLGSDRLLEDWIVGAALGPAALTGVVLGAIALAALALDAFEIIFVLVPVLMPPLLMRVPDATWVAVLALLALQASFMLPPVGYALLMIRGVLAERVPVRALVRSTVPFLAAQVAVLAAVLAFPVLVHLAEPGAGAASPPTIPDDEVSRRMQEMLAPPQTQQPGDAATP